MALPRTEKLSHFAVVIIAVSAVVVSVWQGRISEKHLEIAREHNRLTVKPYLDFFTGWENENKWVIILSNEGIGPAIVKSIEYSYDNKTYTHWDAVLEAAGIKAIRLGSVNIGNNSPIAVEKVIDYLSLRRVEDADRKPFGISVLIKYESIYGDPFELKFDF